MSQRIPLLIVPTVRILVVTDTRPPVLGAGSFSFSQTSGNLFDLELALNAVKNAPLPWVNFEFVTAHRDTVNSSDSLGRLAAATAEFQGFRFDALPVGFSVSSVDQIWLFGFAAAQGAQQTTPALSAAELAVVHQFMDAGGGVLAMGDHESLGSLLCSGIKRVQKMRTWARFDANTGDPQPPAKGPTRHDTLREKPPGSGYYDFDNQTDRFPQPIRVKTYQLGYIPSETIFPKVRARPHPLLCGLKGPIEILPDHMHEGEVIAPTEIRAGDPDWPGTVRPEIIAWADVIAHTDDVYGPVNATSFGAIGAYDGQAAGVGRIVVDSTWHHWVHVNLVGFTTTATQTGNPDALARIYNYFWNVAVWLASPDQQARMSDAAFLLALLAGGLTEIGPVNQLDTQFVGQQALDVLGRYASFCNIEYFVFQGPGLPPALQLSGFPGPDPGPWFHWPMLEYCAGAQVKAIAERFANGQVGDGQPVAALRRQLNDGVHRGLAEMIERETHRAKASLEALEQLKGRLSRR
jgi:hypothetical protein